MMAWLLAAAVCLADDEWKQPAQVSLSGGMGYFYGMGGAMLTWRPDPRWGGSIGVGRLGGAAEAQVAPVPKAPWFIVGVGYAPQKWVKGGLAYGPILDMGIERSRHRLFGAVKWGIGAHPVNGVTKATGILNAGIGVNLGKRK